MRTAEDSSKVTAAADCCQSYKECPLKIIYSEYQKRVIVFSLSPSDAKEEVRQSCFKTTEEEVQCK